MKESLYCKVYVDSQRDRPALLVRLRELLGGEIEGHTLRTSLFEIDLSENDEHDPCAARGSDWFLYSKYLLDIEPVAGASRAEVIGGLSYLLRLMWARGMRAVAACDFEDELARSGESGILIVHLRESIPEDILRDDLVTLLDVCPGDLVPLESIESETMIAYQVVPRTTGFRTTLELYVGRAPASVPRTDHGLARLLARHYRQDVLVSPVAERDPYDWDLISPEGEVKQVRERPSHDADCIVLDE